jgi:hypothetical protein
MSPAPKPVGRRALVCAGSIALGWAQASTFAHAGLRNELLDDLRQPAAWQAVASDQVRASLRRDADGSLCLDYDFAGVAGYAGMRRALPVQWPRHFDLTARLKGSGAANGLQFKLVDASGDSVWWMNRPGLALPAALGDIRIRHRHIQFAWGPAADRALQRTEFVEFVIAPGPQTPGAGGKGSLCLARLALAERAPDPQPWPAPRMQATVHGLAADFGQPREFNGVALRWPAGASARDYDVQASDDARRWRTLRRVRGSDGGLDALYLPETEARHLRIRPGPPRALQRGAMPRIELRDSAQWPDFNAVLAEVAADAPRGDLPRAFVGEQNYWALVGVDGGGARSGLISEDGALEVGRGGYSVEPAVLLDDGTRVAWAGARITQSLREGYLPAAQVRWQHAAFTLEIEAAADGPPAAPELLARYVLRNTGARPHRYTLALALRPWQVNPPQQFLATPGGASAIHALRWDGAGLAVNDRPPLRFTEAPQRVSGLALDGGLGLAALQAAPALHALHALHDPQGHASAALHFSVTLAPGEARTLGWVAPLGARAPAHPQAHGVLTQGQLDARFDAAAAQWRTRLNRATLRVPAEAQPLVDTLRTSLAHILMSRDGPALRPGTRSYARSWVRDGAMMVAGLVRLGEIDAAREFVDWYGGHIFDSGKVPCCVDARGADPVVENDSHGQYLYAVAEVWRHTRDRAFLQRHWPQVQRVVAWQEALRQGERTPANRVPARAHLFGLLPPSISHEGYADKPAYSYWDDFWALRGFKDAVLIAQALGEPAAVQRWIPWRDEFERELAASVAASARHHAIDHIAGAADRGDFDATSTTIALNPAQARVPPALLDATFERYWQEMNARSEGRRAWQDYTPYELRTVGALVRLGQPERAHAMLRFFFNDQRPRGWNQWAEVVLPNPREPRFLGDMPHAWVSSDYIRSALDLFAYEREAEGTLVIGAGLQPEWLAHGDVEVRGLSTPYGQLDYLLARTAGGWRLELPAAQPALSGLAGGVRLAWPGTAQVPRALHNGSPLAWQGRELVLPPAPATVHLTANPP